MKIAVLGLNHGYKFASDAKKMPETDLVAVAGNDPQSAERAKELQVPLYKDYKQLIEACNLDGVIITLPNRLHKEATEFSADHGLDILVEKPIAPTIAEGKAMVEYCDQKGVKLMVGHHRRFSSRIQKLNQLLSSGKIGEIIGVNMLWVLAKDEPYFNETWKITKGGGPLLINGIHDIDNLRYATGLEIENVYAVTRNHIRNNEVEDTASVLLESENGAIVNYFVSDGVPSPWSYEFNLHENPKYHYYDEDCYHFFGTKGSIAFPSFRTFSYDENNYGWEHELNREDFQVEINDPMTAELAHFIDVLQQKVDPLVTGKDALRTLEVLEAIRLSAEKRQKMEV